MDNIKDTFEEGMSLLQDEPIEAFGKIKRAADLGLAEAQFEVALLYREGLCCKYDMQRCLDYCWRAARGHNIEAQNYLIDYYKHEVTNDKELGKALLLSAAEGDPMSAFEYAMLCVSSKDYFDKRDKSEHYLEIAINNGLTKYMKIEEAKAKLEEANNDRIAKSKDPNIDTKKLIKKKFGTDGELVIWSFYLFYGLLIFLMVFGVIEYKETPLSSFICPVLTFIFAVNTESKFYKLLVKQEAPLMSDDIMSLISRCWWNILLCFLPFVIYTYFKPVLFI